MSFSQFYQEGGLFMHLVTITALACIVSIGRRALAVRRTMNSPQGAPPLEGTVTPWFVLAGILVGVLGTVMGFAELCAAVRTVPTEMWHLAIARGAQIVPYPLTWALLTMTPVVFAHGVLRHFELRLGRAGAVTHAATHAAT